MKSSLLSLWRWFDDHLEETMLIMLLVALTLLTGLQVLMRRVFSSPLSWSEELCRYCFMWSGFLGVAYCIRKRCEVRINTFLNLFSGRVYTMMLLVGESLCLGMYALFFCTTWRIIGKAMVSQQVSPALGIPNFLIYLGALLGFGLAFIRQAQTLWEDLRAPRPTASGRADGTENDMIEKRVLPE